MAQDKVDIADLKDAAKAYWSELAYAPGGVIKDMDYAPHRTGLDPALASIRIVDCDTHFTEPPDIFTSRAPAHLKDKVPCQKVHDGVTRWFVGDRDFGILGGNVIRADKRRLLGRLSLPTALYPNVQQHIMATLGGHSHEVRKQVLETNAVKLYNLPF